MAKIRKGRLHLSLQHLTYGCKHCIGTGGGGGVGGGAGGGCGGGRGVVVAVLGVGVLIGYLNLASVCVLFWLEAGSRCQT